MPGRRSTILRSPIDTRDLSRTALFDPYRGRSHLANRVLWDRIFGVELQQRFRGAAMTEPRGYVLGQSERAARRLEIQDAHFADVSERLLEDLALRPNDRVVEIGCGPGGFSRRILRRLGPVAFWASPSTPVRGLPGPGPRPAWPGAGATFAPVLADISLLGSWLDGADVVVGRAVLHHIPLVELMIG